MPRAARAPHRMRTCTGSPRSQAAEIVRAAPERASPVVPVLRLSSVVAPIVGPDQPSHFSAYRTSRRLPMDNSAENLYDSAMAADETVETEGPPPGVLVSGHFDERTGYRAYRSHG